MNHELTPGTLAALVLCAYLAVISIISVIVTIYDKWAAKRRPKKRIRESSLLALALAGGSVAMFAAMLIIRHKTRHAKFMVGLPIVIAVQLAVCFSCFFIKFFVL